MPRSVNWERIEAGWYTSEIGGIVEEDDGWYFYPIDKPDSARVGPFDTLAQAREAAVAFAAYVS